MQREHLYRMAMHTLRALMLCKVLGCPQCPLVSGPLQLGHDKFCPRAAILGCHVNTDGRSIRFKASLGVIGFSPASARHLLIWSAC